MQLPDNTHVEGPGRNSPEALALSEWARESCGTDPQGESYAEWARAMCAFAPAAWVRAALADLVVCRSGAKRKPTVYLNAVVRAWLQRGACPLLEATPLAAGAEGGASSPAAPRMNTFEDRASRRRAALRSLKLDDDPVDEGEEA